MNLRIGKILGGATAAALLLGGANIALAQTYANPDGTGSIIPNGSGAADTGTGQSTANTTGTTSGDTTGSVMGASTTDPNVPNTGSGGDMAGTLAALTLSAIAALGGGAFLLRQRYAR